MKHLVRQMNIVHVSDVHFGKNHICAPGAADWAASGVPDLGALIRSDVEQLLATQPELGQPPKTPLIIAATGDLAETAGVKDDTELERAESFLRHLAQTFPPSPTSPASSVRDELQRLFVVPGNHDVVFTEKKSLERRWQPYCSFYNKLFDGVRPVILDRNAHTLTQLHDRTAEGYIVAEINSALYVAQDSPDADRGQIDSPSVARLRGQLDELRKRDPAAFENAVRVALVHHHPVLLPSLVEPERDYDAIVNSHELLRLLQDFGFHLVLHGHKHYPQTFSYDPDYAWSTKPASPPLLVIAGGSAGSAELPKGTRATNSYNLITIKWHPEAKQARVQVLTRGLSRMGEEGGLPFDRWIWTEYARRDRLLRPLDGIPNVIAGERLLPIDRTDDVARHAFYEASRGNMAVAEVLPSMIEGQAYEARVWIVPHNRDRQNVPVEVTWNAGRKFPRKRIEAKDDPRFCAAFSYWGSMLVEARMLFSDGKTASTFVYARIPGDHGNT